MSGDSPWESEYWWTPERQAMRRHTSEEFGIADPDKVMAQVNEICATRLKE